MGNLNCGAPAVANGVVGHAVRKVRVHMIRPVRHATCMSSQICVGKYLWALATC